jgi:hypothetical protein
MEIRHDIPPHSDTEGKDEDDSEYERWFFHWKEDLFDFPIPPLKRGG